MALWVKGGFLHKHEDPCLDPTTHVKCGQGGICL